MSSRALKRVSNELFSDATAEACRCDSRCRMRFIDGVLEKQEGYEPANNWVEPADVGPIVLVTYRAIVD